MVVGRLAVEEVGGEAAREEAEAWNAASVGGSGGVGVGVAFAGELSRFVDRDDDAEGLPTRFGAGEGAAGDVGASLGVGKQGDGVGEAGGEVEDEGHLHLLWDTVNEEGVELEGEGLLGAELLEAGVVGVVLGGFADLAGAVGAGVDDHVAFGLAFADGGPGEGGWVVDEGFFLEGGDKGGLEGGGGGSGLCDGDGSRVGGDGFEGDETARDGFVVEDGGGVGPGDLLGGEGLVVGEVDSAVEGEDGFEAGFGAGEAKDSPGELVGDAAGAVVAADAGAGDVGSDGDLAGAS